MKFLVNCDVKVNIDFLCVFFIVTIAAEYRSTNVQSRCLRNQAILEFLVLVVGDCQSRQN